MNWSAMTKAAMLAGVALLGMPDLGLAQAPRSRDTEHALAAHRDAAKAHMKGELLDGFNKALTQNASAALSAADRVRADAEAVAQCNAVLEKTFPQFQKWSTEVGREYRRLSSENRALRAEYERLRALPKWAPRYQLEAHYNRRLARHVVAYRVYLAKDQARRSMLLGEAFCIRVIQKHDPALGAKWSVRRQELLAAW
jgi:hypothetical protein